RGAGAGARACERTHADIAVAPGGGHPAACGTALPAPPGILSSPEPGPPPAAAEDARRPGGVAFGGGRAAAGPGGVGRPALGRRVDAGVSRPGAGPGADSPHAHPADLSTGVSPAVG